MFLKLYKIKEYKEKYYKKEIRKKEDKKYASLILISFRKIFYINS